MPPALILGLRHGEKPANAEHPDKPLDAAGPGLDEGGQVNPSSLTIRGWQRAGALSGTMLCGLIPGDAGLLTVLVPNYGHPTHHRPFQTMHPLAARLDTEPAVAGDTTDVDALHAKVVALEGTVVVCWEHDALAALAGRLAPEAPAEWPDGRFDVVWRFTLQPQEGTYGWAQLAQMLLPGDLV